MEGGRCGPAQCAKKKEEGELQRVAQVEARDPAAQGRGKASVGRLRARRSIAVSYLPSCAMKCRHSPPGT